MEFRGVIPSDLACGALWPQISALVEKAMAYGRGEYELDDVRDALEAEDYMFAIGEVVDGRVEFVAICALCIYPRKRVLYVVYGAGRGGSKLRDTLIASARTLKADWIETRCRQSVARLYRRVGFEVSYCVPILEVTE